jgi:hypothetical protein
MYCPHRFIGKLLRPAPIRLDIQLVVDGVQLTVAVSRNPGRTAGTPYPALRPSVQRGSTSQP